MKVKYTFATRDTVEIEVNDDWAKELKELDRQEYNSNKKETRRHCSADAHFEKFGFEIADKTDFVEKFLSKEIWHKLLKPLTAKQKELVYKKFVEKQLYTTIAKSEKVTPSATQNTRGEYGLYKNIVYLVVWDLLPHRTIKCSYFVNRHKSIRLYFAR